MDPRPNDASEPKQPPIFAAPTPGQTVQPRSDSLKRTDTLSLAVRCLTGMIVVFSAVAGGVEFKLAEHIRRADRVGIFTRMSEQLDTASQMLAVGILGMFLVNGIMTAVLIKRMVDNGEEMKPEFSDHDSHWAITGWIVPLLNLVRPYQMIQQIWATSDPRTSRTFRPTVPDIVNAWWGSFVVLLIADRIVSRLLPREDPTLLDFARQSTGIAINNGIRVASGLLFIVALRKLTQHHEQALDHYLLHDTSEPDS